ncbi:L domain-like protein [Neocallimastix californiae]|uniref:L domain-like protein n=1 Tax=Neocallimastix californiae TaxID=1754190 RepID=A0A1Y2ACP6_9FUNG|nr:L domain-like protein [Neocallimastix californiae]|eukprot:ORY20318.1 L domain-like protein [Neocallimastix californiae]
MVKLILQNKLGLRLSLKALALCLITSNILSVRTQEIADCAVVREAAEFLGEYKVNFGAYNCCDSEIITCNANHVIGFKLVGLSCFDFKVKLDDTIDKLANLEYLESFEFSNQSWCERPNNISKLKNLKTLIMANNHFKDTLPEDLIQLTKLEKLNFTSNKYYGSIPNSYSKFKNLKSLILNKNNLSGYIPYSLTKLENLTEIKLFSNIFQFI